MQKDLENISARVWKSYAFTGKTCQIGRNTQVSILREFFLVSSEYCRDWKKKYVFIVREALVYELKPQLRAFKTSIYDSDVMISTDFWRGFHGV